MSNDAFNMILNDYIKEKRLTRRWGIFFKLSFLIIVLMIVFQGKKEPGKHGVFSGEHTAVIKLYGTIMPGGQANAASIKDMLQKAAKTPNVKGIIIKVNSPGGTSVQSDMIRNEILRIKKEKDRPKIIAVVEDYCTSGAYLISSAADSIYANETSLIGSIGVAMPSMGFVGLIDKLGIERRLFTAGENKGTLDPFSPVKDSQKEIIETQLKVVHDFFIREVKESRGDRLKPTDDMFSGRTWTGKEALELGLIDGLYDYETVLKDIIRVENTVDYSSDNFIEKLTNSFYKKSLDVLDTVIGVY